MSVGGPEPPVADALNFARRHARPTYVGAELEDFAPVAVDEPFDDVAVRSRTSRRCGPYQVGDLPWREDHEVLRSARAAVPAEQSKEEQACTGAAEEPQQGCAESCADPKEP